jgi:uncharacterized repeat protein (TIGR03803 family)
MGVLRTVFSSFALAAGVFAAAAPVAGAAAATVATAYAFDGTTGMSPRNGNLLFLGGSLYGSTYAGGADDLGAIVAVPQSANGTATLLHSFTGTQGAHPNGSLVADASGNLYGTTQAGGAGNAGTIFKLTKPVLSGGNWGFAVLHEFSGAADGAQPMAGLTFGTDGALYGTAQFGGGGTCSTNAGVVGCGTVFRITTIGSFRLLHAFANVFVSGRFPSTNVVVDPAGNIVGTTSAGFSEEDGGGNLFAIAPNGTFTIVAQFSVRGPVVNPVGTIARDAAGNVYGMVTFAGMYGSPPVGEAIFKVAALTHRPSIVLALGTQASASGVTLRSNVLYFTTTGGFIASPAVSSAAVMHGPGMVYALPLGATAATPIASLDYANLSPVGGVVADSAGDLWGQSSAGGLVCPAPSNGTQTGCGTIFKITP